MILIIGVAVESVVYLRMSLREINANGFFGWDEFVWMQSPGRE